MTLPLFVYAVLVGLTLLAGLAHLFFPDRMARLWRVRATLDVERRWQMQQRGAIALGLAFFFCWLLVEAGGILRYLR